MIMGDIPSCLVMCLLVHTPHPPPRWAIPMFSSLIPSSSSPMKAQGWEWEKGGRAVASCSSFLWGWKSYIWAGEIPWRREWQPTPVFLPGKSHGQRRLVGYSPWGHKELDTTKQLTLLLSFHRAGKFHLGLVHYLQASLTINLDLNRTDP